MILCRFRSLRSTSYLDLQIGHSQSSPRIYCHSWKWKFPCPIEYHVSNIPNRHCRSCTAWCLNHSLDHSWSSLQTCPLCMKCKLLSHASYLHPIGRHSKNHLGIASYPSHSSDPRTITHRKWIRPGHSKFQSHVSLPLQRTLFHQSSAVDLIKIKELRLTFHSVLNLHHMCYYVFYLVLVRLIAGYIQSLQENLHSVELWPSWLTSSLDTTTS